MRKLFLGIILGSLFFVYGERPNINLGDRIGDKINFVGTKGENYSVWFSEWLAEYYFGIKIEEEGKSELIITGPDLKFNIAAGDFEAVKNTKITDMYYLWEREDVNDGFLKIIEGYEDIPFDVEKYKNYLTKDIPYDEKKSLPNIRIKYMSPFSLTSTILINEDELSYYAKSNIKKVKIDYNAEYEKVLTDENYLNKILDIKDVVKNKIASDIINVKFIPNIEYAYIKYKKPFCFNFKKKDGKVIYTLSLNETASQFQCYEYYEKDLKNDNYIQYAFREYFTRIYANYERNKKEMILAYLAYKAGSPNHYLFSVVE